MSRVLLLGIDALDRELLQRFAPHLPALTELGGRGLSFPVRSTFPPDSDTAWATIATGLNPAQHGVVHFVDPLEKSHRITNVGTPNEVLRGRTFWEIAARAGRATVALFPHLCHPIWPTGGVMVARGSTVAGVESTHPDLLGIYPDPEILPGVRGFPGRGAAGLAEYRDRLFRQASADAEFALSMMRQFDWDLFFVYWSTIDAIGHFFWHCFDPGDPLYQPGNPFEQVIPDTYRLFDAIVGRFLDALDDDTTLIVLSDHGHAGRPTTLVAINEILRRGGLLQMRSRATSPHAGLVELAKRQAVRTVHRYGLAPFAGSALRRFPDAMRLFTRPPAIDWQRTVACATDMSGIKSYPYGGIAINRDVLAGRGYESVRSEIIALVERECMLANGESLLRFIARREDIYQGPYIDRYPDIVLELRQGYGVGWQVNSPLIVPAMSRQIVPGSHRVDTGTFLIQGDPPLPAGEIDLHDIAGLVLELLDVPTTGRSSTHPALAGRSST